MNNPDYHGETMTLPERVTPDQQWAKRVSMEGMIDRTFSARRWSRRTWR